MTSKKTPIIATDKNHLEVLIYDAMQEHGSACDLNHIDVSRITDMSDLFVNTLFAGSIDQWDVSNVIDMENMFFNSRFNGYIGGWNVSNVKSMNGMFLSAPFNSSVEHWDVSNVQDMNAMFHGTKFQQDVSKWNVSKVLDFNNIFSDSPFKGNISQWSIDCKAKTYKVFDMHRADSFDSPSVFHWLAALSGPRFKPAWQKHFDAVAPIAQGIASSPLETAILIQNMWLELEHIVRPACSLIDVDLNVFEAPGGMV